MDCLGKDRVFLHTQKKYLLTIEEQYKFNQYIDKLKKSVPLAYILGIQPFHKYQFIVSPQVLIPRPETEILVDEVINIGEKIYREKQSVRILDLGAGSGCIGLSIAAEKPEWFICLSDFKKEITNLINENKTRLNVTNCVVTVVDWLTAFSKDSFDIIVTNPPYIDKSSDKIEETVKKYEPDDALYADDRGLSYIKKLIGSSKKSLKNNGYLLIENGYDQSQEIEKFLVENDFKDIEVLLDYNDICRFTKCRHIDG
tara:strand:+ start:18 stop:785 length:768 start_codon:yes stop_codon:yes gene_type:complete